MEAAAAGPAGIASAWSGRLWMAGGVINRQLTPLSSSSPQAVAAENRAGCDSRPDPDFAEPVLDRAGPRADLAAVRRVRALRGPGRLLPGSRASRCATPRRCARRCPVREECLDFALRLKVAHGVWGGLSERERRTLRRDRHRSREPRSRSPSDAARLAMRCAEHARRRRRITEQVDERAARRRSARASTTRPRPRSRRASADEDERERDERALRSPALRDERAFVAARGAEVAAALARRRGRRHAPVGVVDLLLERRFAVVILAGERPDARSRPGGCRGRSSAQTIETPGRRKRVCHQLRAPGWDTGRRETAPALRDPDSGRALSVGAAARSRSVRSTRDRRCASPTRR